MTVLAMITALTAYLSAVAQPVRTITSFPDDQQLPYLGNGVIGYRIKPNPFASWKAAVSGYVTGHEGGGWETLAYAPYPLAMDFRMDEGEPFSQLEDRVRVHRQRLDMSCGELTTEMSFPMGDGTARATVVQFLSRSTPVVSCQEVKLVVPVDGRLAITPRVVSGPGNRIYAAMPEHHDKVTDIMLGYEPDDARSRCGVSVRLDFSDRKVTRQPFASDQPESARTFLLDAQAGETITLRTLAATVTSIYHPEPDLESCRLVNWAATLGFDKLRRLNREAWADIWRSRVRVTGDERAQEYLDCAMFYMFSSVHPSCRTSMPPFGLSQVQNYFGHVFWDTDTYTTPALILLSPETARMTIDFRRRNLEAAIRQAQTYGYAGAMYPWESGIHGEEATPSTADTGWLQQHVNMCVAIAAWQYQLAAGDVEHARETTWPIVRAVAEWVASRVEKTQRGYEIRDTMSAHEGMSLHNSCYVNGIAAETLRIATRCAAIVGASPDPKWREIAERLFIPTGPAPEDSGIDGDIIYMHDEGWIRDGASVDMFMIGFPFDLPFDRALLRRTYNFYRGMGQNKLSMGVVFKIGDGAFLGDRDGQRAHFDRTLNEKWESAWGMGTEYTDDPQTCFVTTQAGMLQTVLMAMTGLRFEPDNWTKYPACLPAGWSKIECDRIHLGGEPCRLEAVDGRRATLTPIQ